MKVLCHFHRQDNGEEWLSFFCPGCRIVHRVLVRKPAEVRGKVWAWNQSLERPSLIPTVRLRSCCFVLADGVFEYLPECKHPLAGKKVGMEPL